MISLVVASVIFRIVSVFVYFYCGDDARDCNRPALGLGVEGGEGLDVGMFFWEEDGEVDVDDGGEVGFLHFCWRDGHVYVSVEIVAVFQSGLVSLMFCRVGRKSCGSKMN
jgi:hypothetical protein